MFCLILFCISNYNLQTWREKGKSEKDWFQKQTNKQKNQGSEALESKQELEPTGESLRGGAPLPLSGWAPGSSEPAETSVWFPGLGRSLTLSEEPELQCVFSVHKKDQIWGGVGWGKRIHTESFKVTCHIWNIKERQKRQTDTWIESWKQVAWTLVLRSHSTL